MLDFNCKQNNMTNDSTEDAAGVMMTLGTAMDTTWSHCLQGSQLLKVLYPGPRVCWEVESPPSLDRTRVAPCSQRVDRVSAQALIKERRRSSLTFRDIFICSGCKANPTEETGNGEEVAFSRFSEFLIRSAPGIIFTCVHSLEKKKI